MAAQVEALPEDEEVSTVFVGGLPSDATPRELDNLCRFLPGFVNAKVDTRKGITMFVSFDNPHTAHAAISQLHNQHFDRSYPSEPMRAHLARSNMRSGPRVCVSAPGSLKRPRAVADVDTVASVGAADLGMDDHSLHCFFAELPGFVAYKSNPKMGGGFAKFASPKLAEDAIHCAEMEEIPAAFAKTSMTGGGQSQSQAAHYTHQDCPPIIHRYEGAVQDDHGWAKQPRMEVDTVASVGATNVGIEAKALEEFFARLPGFIAFRKNSRMGGGFAKFESPELAQQAVAAGESHGVPAAMARTSMSSVCAD